MRKLTEQPVAVPAFQRRLHLVQNVDADAGAGQWDAQIKPIIRRVIRAMSEAHPSTLMEELLGPLRQLHVTGLPNNTDDLVSRIAEEINDALPGVVRHQGDIGKAVVRWMSRMEVNGHEPARQQYRELLALLG